MILVFNPGRLTGQPFFRDLINYLYKRNDVSLRQIKQDFPQVKQLERSLEEYIQAGYIRRYQRRYYLQIQLTENEDQLQEIHLDDSLFIDSLSPAYQKLLTLEFSTRLANKTNQAVLIEQTDFARTRLTLSNYFYKLKSGYPLSQEQQILYAILGDVNPEYALKYMTTFLLKFGRKDRVKQKRPDIFVQSLVILGYIAEIEDQTYSLTMTFDHEKLIFHV
ncbi:DUF1803 domain-containing protein [Streptococcus dentasini]